ncbi:hypothetical protein ACN6MT_01820 [Neobacillus niacini]|uniref:hypothetical protein n=1 Tax=Neobacillus niacini TaxID=86668 RepID=UPI003B011299
MEGLGDKMQQLSDGYVSMEGIEDKAHAAVRWICPQSMILTRSLSLAHKSMTRLFYATILIEIKNIF